MRAVIVAAQERQLVRLHQAINEEKAAVNDGESAASHVSFVGVTALRRGSLCPSFSSPQRPPAPSSALQRPPAPSSAPQRPPAPSSALLPSQAAFTTSHHHRPRFPAINSDGLTLLHAATLRGDAGLVTALVQRHGASVTKTDKRGNQPLHVR